MSDGWKQVKVWIMHAKKKKKIAPKDCYKRENIAQLKARYVFRSVCVSVCKHFQREYLRPAKGVLLLKVHRGCISLFNRLLILAASSAFALKCVHFFLLVDSWGYVHAGESGSGSEGEACSGYQA